MLGKRKFEQPAKAVFATFHFNSKKLSRKRSHGNYLKSGSTPKDNYKTTPLTFFGKMARGPCINFLRVC